MEPLKPTTRESLLADRPQAAPGDVDEYERLLAEQFIEDPDTQAAPQFMAQRTRRQDRLKVLHDQLFGTSATGESDK